MLINVRISELHAETSNSIPLSLLLGISLFSVLNEISPFLSTKITGENLVVNILNFYTTNPKIVYVTSKLWDGYLAETSHISSIGNIMYTNYFL
jgi:NADH-ubiquinone oxidoreductase chain 6